MRSGWDVPESEGLRAILKKGGGWESSLALGSEERSGPTAEPGSHGEDLAENESLGGCGGMQGRGVNRDLGECSYLRVSSWEGMGRMWPAR